MRPVLTKHQAYKLDKNTVESNHLSQEQLMDNAGKAVAQFFCEKIEDPFNQKVVVVCGKGNNGGDGIVTHSYLKLYNVSSRIIFTEIKHVHSKLLKKYKVLVSEYSIYTNKTNFEKYDWIVDGIFGIGLSRDLNDKYKKLIKKLNKNKNIISIDIASGLYADGDMTESYINAKHVLSFGFSKLGALVDVKSIGIRENDSKTDTKINNSNFAGSLILSKKLPKPIKVKVMII